MTAASDTQRLKYAVEGCINGIWGDEPNGADDLVVVRVADFDRQRCCVELGDSPTIRAVPESARSRRLLRKGDLLIEKSGGGEQQPVGNVVLFNEDRPAVCSNFVARMPVVDSCDSRYVAYVFRALYAEGRNVPHVKQTSGIQNLDSESYLNERVWLPAKNTQEYIADFLDEQTARIDALIAEKEKLVGALKDIEEVTGFDLVTRGLTASQDRVSYSEAWLAEVPAHWRLSKLRHVARIGNGSTPKRDKEEYWTGGSIPWLNSGSVNNPRIHDASDFVTEAARKECHLPMVRVGSTVVALTGQGKTRGTAAFAEIETTINQHLAYIAPFDGRLTDEFLWVALTGFYSVLRHLSEGEGSTKGALTCEQLNQFRLPLPPVDEQVQLVQAYKVRTQAIEELMAHAREHIERLREYRASLISAAVTGQLPVPGVNTRSA
ncbi:restriction endonuclease subunit S [Hydrogenophaga sp.]|uniref:restriction endonuclease subunit S n=1 Tax=Hydrogenophaga sp. TaxID=1904254 RepID=UPI002720C4C8|nr:restriction endonuclease subunit S [Hydrogenophaga sp.]MDO9437722.1 restriction endonuclease subunit S [Hydrogenophaga sp.]